MIRKFSLALAAWLYTLPASAQTTVDLSIDEAGAVATQALLAGDAQVAFGIADAILSQIPDNQQALLVMAGAAPQVGDPARGRAAGAQAYRQAETDIQRYEAARLTALAAAREERFTIATFWLRRALSNAPNATERQRTINDARTVTQRNPLSLQFSASLVPSSNVNGGAEDAESTAPGNPTGGTLSEDSLALEGVRGTLSFGANYRLQETPETRTTVGLRYQLGRVRITEDTNVPDDAFDTTYYELNVRHDRVLDLGTISFLGARAVFEYRDLDLIFDRSDPANPIFEEAIVSFDKYDIWRLGIVRQIPLSQRDLLSASITREWFEYDQAGIGEVDRFILRGGVTHGLENGDRIGWSLTYTISDGDSPNFTSTDTTISGNYSWARPVGPVSLSVGGGLRFADFPDYQLLLPVDGGRQDQTYFVNANVGFPQIEFFGFNPGFRIEASEAESNVSRFDRTSFSVGLTVNSVF